jgi:hypothetical protein
MRLLYVSSLPSSEGGVPNLLNLYDPSLSLLLIPIFTNVVCIKHGIDLPVWTLIDCLQKSHRFHSQVFFILKTVQIKKNKRKKLHIDVLQDLKVK